MPVRDLIHRYHDIEIEAERDPDGPHLVKVLALDGRRFTYRVKTGLDEETVAFIRRMIDSGMRSDLVIERIDGQFRAESPVGSLKKHG